jgi:hypothetical protein
MLMRWPHRSGVRSLAAAALLAAVLLARASAASEMASCSAESCTARSPCETAFCDAALGCVQEPRDPPASLCHGARRVHIELLLVVEEPHSREARDLVVGLLDALLASVPAQCVAAPSGVPECIVRAAMASFDTNGELRIIFPLQRQLSAARATLMRELRVAAAPLSDEAAATLAALRALGSAVPQLLEGAAHRHGARRQVLLVMSPAGAVVPRPEDVSGAPCAHWLHGGTTLNTFLLPNTLSAFLADEAGGIQPPTYTEPAAAIMAAMETAGLALLRLGREASWTALVNGASASAISAFGPPAWAVSFADRSHFSPGATLTNLDRHGFNMTLQGALLAHGLDARVLDLASLAEPRLPRRLFGELTAEDALGDCDLCLSAAECDAQTGEWRLSRITCPDRHECLPDLGCVQAGQPGWPEVTRKAPLTDRQRHESGFYAKQRFAPYNAHTLTVSADGLAEGTAEQPGGGEGVDARASGKGDTAGPQQEPKDPTGSDVPCDKRGVGRLSPCPPLYRTARDAPSDACWTREQLRPRPLPVQEVQPDESFAVRLKEARRPAILRNSVAATWPAMQSGGERRWSMAYLREALAVETLDDTKVSRSDFRFTNADAGAAMSRDGMCLDLNMSFVERNLSRSAFFDGALAFNANAPEYLYWFGLLPKANRPDVQPNEKLFISLEDRSRHHQYLWISTPRVEQRTHFDMDHNFFVQVVGTKRFTLFPPYEQDKLYTFPRLHPLWHKSQVDFHAPDIGAFPRYAEAEVYEAVLEPGDLLYVPPLWWHNVESLTESVSLSTWSHSAVYTTAHTVYGFMLRLDDIHNPRGRFYALRAFADMLVRRFEGFWGTTRFMRRLLAARYAGVSHLFPPAPDINALCRADARIPSARHVLADAQMDAGIVAEHLMRMEPELRELLLMDYLEELAYSVLDADRVPAFFRYCFRGQDYQLSADLDIWV